MNSYTVITILCSLVIFSYLFDLFAKKSKIPSVLLLLGCGILLKYVTNYLGIAVISFNQILPVIGTVGLVLIVLEGALELKFEKKNARIIKNAAGAAFFILLFTVGAITTAFYFMTGKSIQICLLNSIPLGIISSAIAIPTVANLAAHKKEFIIYESALSDIIGIIFFNFATLFFSCLT